MAFAATGLPAGCVDIEGGSVEVPWALFAPDGRAINDCDCTQPQVRTIRLVLESLETGAHPCDGRPDCEFACARKIGATPFVIPPGNYLMSVVPLDASGSALPFATPSPLTRTVRVGQPTELEAMGIEAPCAGARPPEQGPNCGGIAVDRPCSAN